MSFPNRGEIQSNHLKYMKTRPSMRAQLLATNVSFYAVAVGTAPLQYDWFFNGVKLENETNAVQIYANATNSTLQLNRAASRKQIPIS
jgi:hypothetical protein